MVEITEIALPNEIHIRLFGGHYGLDRENPDDSEDWVRVEVYRHLEAPRQNPENRYSMYLGGFRVSTRVHDTIFRRAIRSEVEKMLKDN